MGNLNRYLKKNKRSFNKGSTTSVLVPVEREADAGPYLEITIFPEDPEVIAMRERIHERIQVEMNHEETEASEEMLEAPPDWGEVLDLMMETKILKEKVMK